MADPAPGEYGYTGGKGSYGTFAARCPTAPDFRPLEIEAHVEMLRRLDDGAAHATAAMWGNAASLFEATRDNISSYGESLRQVWRSDAAEPFFTHIGGTLYSLRLWAAAARANEAAMHRLASAIQTAQQQMATLYAGFKTEVAAIDENEFGPGWMGDEDEDDMEAMVEEKSAQSRAILETLAQVFTGTPTQVEGKFAGPADARPITPERMQAALGGPGSGAGAPQAPGGGGGAAGAPPGAPPAAPPRGTPHAVLIPGPGGQALLPPPAAPVRPPAPAAPVRGPAPTAPVMPATGPGGIGAPPAPPVIGAAGAIPGAAQGPPPVAPAIGSAGAPSSGLAGTRGAPPAPPTGVGAGTTPAGAQALRGAPPSAPGSPPPAPPSNALAGRNAPASPAMPPGGRGAPPSAAARPQIPGRAGGPGAPGMAPPAPPGGRGLGNRPGQPGRGAPGAPGLQGRQAPHAPGAGMGPPSPGASAPRSLLGRANPDGSRPGRATNGRAPIRPGAPGSAGQPGLRGRSGPVRAARSETAQTARAALRRGLDGRGISTGRSGPASAAASGPTGRPATAPQAKRHEEKKAAAAVPQMVGDEELFAVDPAAPAVIERKQEKVHAKRPGPALGRG